MRTYRKPRRGFTLVETLVVIALIGLLLALLLPAIQQARETGRRAICASNLHQFGLAAANFHDSRGRLPAGVSMPYAQAGNDPLTGGAANPFGPNWAIRLLPFLEAAELYERAQADTYPGTKNLADLASYNLSWRAVRGEAPAGFSCPSDPGSRTPFTDAAGRPPESGWARGNYACNGGTADSDHHIRGDNGIGIQPYPTLSKGPLMSIEWGARWRDVTDGLTKTFAFHKVRVGVSSTDRRGVWAMGMPGASMVVAGRDGNPTPNNNLEEADEIEGCDSFWYAGIGSRNGMGCRRAATNYGMAAQARSAHPGGVNACFCDGHVTFVNDNVSQTVWVALQAINDGQAPNFDF